MFALHVMILNSEANGGLKTKFLGLSFGQYGFGIVAGTILGNFGMWVGCLCLALW